VSLTKSEGENNKKRCFLIAIEDFFILHKKNANNKEAKGAE
jgi:hypothetical protein